MDVLAVRQRSQIMSGDIVGAVIVDRMAVRCLRGARGQCFPAALNSACADINSRRRKNSRTGYVSS